MRHRPCGLAATLAFVLAAPVIAGAALPPVQDPKTDRAVEEALARPLSPGAVARLVLYGNRPAVIERLTQALAHEEPEVRAVAARVAFATRHRGLADALVKALAVESNPLAGAEIVRALTLIQGRAADDLLFAAFDRLDPRAASAWMEVVERTRPTDFLPRLTTLPGKAPIGAALATYAATHGDDVARAFEALPPDSPLESIFLSMMGESRYRPAALPWPVLAAGITAGGAPRRVVVFDLLRRQSIKQPLAPEAGPALSALAERVTPADDAWLAIAFELARRTAGGAQRPLAEVIAALPTSKLPFRPWSDALLRTLSPDEEAALRATMGVALAPRESWEDPAKATVHGVVPGSQESVTRMVRPLTPSVLADILKLAGCKPRVDQVVAMNVSYRPTGQVRQVSAPANLGFSSDDCNDAARLLAILDVATGHVLVAAERTDLVLVGLRPNDVVCKRASTARAGAPALVSEGIRPPRKIRNTSPVYPVSLQQQRVQGMVIIQAAIAATGCVAEAEIVQSAHVGFNVSALLAVSDWLYEPTQVDGVDVPVIMMVIVNFTL